MTDAILGCDSYSGLRPRRANERAADMSEKEGTLRMMASGRWAVCRAGREPVEITSGERFRVEFLGEMRLTRMEFRRYRSQSASQYRLPTAATEITRRP